MFIMQVLCPEVQYAIPDEYADMNCEEQAPIYCSTLLCYLLLLDSMSPWSGQDNHMKMCK
jgi:hypothetical protein